MINFDKLPSENDIANNGQEFITSIVNKAPENIPFAPTKLFRGLYFSEEDFVHRRIIDRVLKNLLVDSGFAVRVGEEIQLTKDAKTRVNSSYREILRHVDNSVKIENHGNFIQGGSSSKNQQIKSITAPPKKKDDQSKWYIKHSMKLIGAVILLIIAAIINYVFRLKF